MTQFFGNSLGSSAGQIFHRMKPQPLLNVTNAIAINEIPTVRTGISNIFRVTNASTVLLVNTSTNTTIATITSTTHLSASTCTAYYLSSADQCLYVLLRNTTTVQMIKIDDTTGTVTVLGSPITPANISNWPAAASAVNFGFMDNLSGNNIRILNNGFIHQIDKTTGALITEDVAITFGSFSVTGINYLNSNLDIGCVNSGVGVPETSSTSVDSVYLPRSVSLKTGRTPSNVGLVNTGYMLPAPNSANMFIAVDDKYLCFVDSTTRPTSSPTPLKLVLRSDFERLLEDTVNFYAGIL